MALSDYERRILREIESQLALPGPGRWARCVNALRCDWLRLLITVAVLAAGVVAGLFGPTAFALVVVTVTGFALGWLWAPRWRRRSRVR